MTKKSDRTLRLEQHRDNVARRIEAVEKSVCAQMYCDTIDEAMAIVHTPVIGKETHIALTLSDERQELSFLRKRLEMLDADLAKVDA